MVNCTSGATTVSFPASVRLGFLALLVKADLYLSPFNRWMPLLLLLLNNPIICIISYQMPLDGCQGESVANILQFKLVLNDAVPGGVTKQRFVHTFSVTLIR